MTRLTRLSIDRPRRTIGIWAVLLALLAPLAFMLPSALRAGGFNNPRSDGALAQAVVQRAFHEAPNSLQVVVHGDTDVRPRVASVVTAAERLDHVTVVRDYRRNPDWLSRDGRTTLVQVAFDSDETTTENLVEPLHEAAEEALAGQSVDFQVTGGPALEYALNVQSQKDVEHAELIALPLLFVVLLLVFRSVAAMIVPLALAGVTLTATQGLGYLLTRFGDVSILFNNIVSMIGLAVAVDYSLFIIKRYREELAEGGDVKRSVQRTMETAGHSVLFSGFAVMVAMLALAIPRIMVFTSIAAAGALVTAVALAISMTLLPAVLTLMGPRINWGSMPARRRSDTARRRVGAFRRPLVVTGALVTGFVVLALPMTGMRLQVPVASASILPADTEARVGLDRIEDDLGLHDLFPVEVVVTAPGSEADQLLAATKQVESVAKESSATSRVQAVTSLGVPDSTLRQVLDGRHPTASAETLRAVDRFVTTLDGNLVGRVLVATREGPDTVSTHELVKHLRASLDSPPGDTTISVGGATARGVDFDDTVVHSLPLILLTVGLVTFLLLAWAFGSWLLPLVALAFNAMAVGGSLGLVTLLFQGDGSQINSVTPLLLFAVMFGLSMDYMVIMISRMREHYLAGGSHLAAVTEGVRRTAGLVNGAAAIMVAVFLAFGVAKVNIVQQLGIGLAIAVALDALVIRLLVMPAVLQLVGPRVWGRARPEAEASAKVLVEVNR